MQDKELSNQFITFCESQPEDKGIDHSSWRSCAVGEFTLSKFHQISPVEDYPLEDGCILHIEPEIRQILSGLFGDRFCEDYEGNPVLSEIVELNEKTKLHTYGEFTKFLKQHI